MGTKEIAALADELIDLPLSDEKNVRVLERAAEALRLLSATSSGDAMREALKQVVKDAFNIGLEQGKQPRGKTWPSVEEELTGWLDRALATPTTPSADVARLDFFTHNTNCELSCSWEEEDGPWQVHQVNGGRNDREWTLIGSGATPRKAIDAAIQSAAHGGGTECVSYIDDVERSFDEAPLSDNLKPSDPVSLDQSHAYMVFQRAYVTHGHGEHGTKAGIDAILALIKGPKS